MNICAIAAVSENNVIGKDGSLPWDLPGDLEHFRSTTTGHSMIMGRKTFDSFPKPLPNRKHIVLTRSNKLNNSNEQVVYVNSVEEALDEVKDDKVFIIGGQSIYELFFDRLDTMILTHVHKKYDGDTYFPIFDENNWEKTIIDETNKFTIIKYNKKNL